MSLLAELAKLGGGADLNQLHKVNSNFQQVQSVPSYGIFPGGEENDPILEHQMSNDIDMRSANKLSRMRAPAPRHRVRYDPVGFDYRQSQSTFNEFRQGKKFGDGSRHETKTTKNESEEEMP